MAELKEIAIYGLLAIIIVVAIILALGLSGFTSSAYSIRVKLSQEGTILQTIYPYQTSYYAINITNTGKRQITGMPVGFYLDGVPETENTISIPAGETVTLLRNYTYPSPGPYTFEAVADPGHIFNIADRNASQSSITTNVTEPELPNVYTSVPNANMTYTQSFALSGVGALEIAAVAGRYDITSISDMFGPYDSISTKVFENAYPFTANVYGAYSEYSDNSIAYAAWLQGTIDPAVIGAVVSSFGKDVNELSLPTGIIGYVNLGNSTSMCTFYSNGWTKIITYYNASNAGTCETVSTNSYTPTESNVLTNVVVNDTYLTHLQSGFFYTNSSVLGSSLAYSGMNATATNIFQNNYGLFISSIRKDNNAINISAIKNATCYGLIYNSSNLSVCSYLIPTSTGNYSLPYGLVNSSYITPNYTLNMYSLVNNTELIAAHDNAAHLLSRLGINSSFVEWQEAFGNSCSFSNSSIGCKFLSMSQNGTASFNITNKLPKPLRINTLNCEIEPGFENVSINMTIEPNSTTSISQPCSTIAVPTVEAQASYTLIMNYTYGNATMVTSGFLNVTNQNI
ncbi:MAG: CARDB domain-containing protein [Candidatus Micrarchaeaceae archaeon]